MVSNKLDLCWHRGHFGGEHGAARLKRSLGNPSRAEILVNLILKENQGQSKE